MYYTENVSKTKDRRLQYLYVPGYAMEAMRTDRITPRQTILLSYVDNWVNRRKKDERPVTFHLFRTNYLRQVLAVTRTDTVHDLILDLASKRPRLLEAKKMDKWWWRLSTKLRELDELQNGLQIPRLVQDGFEAGELRPMEAFLLSRIVSFTLGGYLCYTSNRWWGGSWE